MSKKSRIPQTPRHVMVYDEDWEYLEARFGRHAGGLGSSAFIRELVHKRVGQMRAKTTTMKEQGFGVGQGRPQGLGLLLEGDE